MKSISSIVLAALGCLSASQAAEIKWFDNQFDQTELNGAASFHESIK